MEGLSCRACGHALEHTVVDLGCSPLANSYLRREDLDRPETFYPLHARVCGHCLLVQLPEVVPPEAIFREYAYFSSYSDTWLRHAREYADEVSARFGLGPASRVVEIASNDGYLLRNFRDRGMRVLGIEPAGNVAAAARAAGIPTLARFFGLAAAREIVAQEGGTADLLVGNNVLAHVPALGDFVAGLEVALARGGVLTMEFPHLLRLLEQNQFDTIYHEHFSYLSLAVVERVFGAAGLTVFDVEELPTHGGSLRIYARHTGDGRRPVEARVEAARAREETAGLGRLETYRRFGERVQATKRSLLAFLIEARGKGLRIAGYGAPAKGNTLLNYCGIRTDLLEFTVDRSPHKQGTFLPGTRIPVLAPDALRKERPDLVLILPWNLRDEVMEQMKDVLGWGGRFVVAIPEVQVHP